MNTFANNELSGLLDMARAEQRSRLRESTHLTGLTVVLGLVGLTLSAVTAARLTEPIGSLTGYLVPIGGATSIVAAGAMAAGARRERDQADILGQRAAMIEQALLERGIAIAPGGQSYEAGALPTSIALPRADR